MSIISLTEDGSWLMQLNIDQKWKTPDATNNKHYYYDDKMIISDRHL